MFPSKILLKISEVVDIPVLVNYDGDELDQLLKNFQLEETGTNDSGNGNDGNLHVNSQAPLFDAVWSLTDETPNGKAGLAPNDGRDGKRRRERGPCQRLTLLTPTNGGTCPTPNLPEQIGLVPETPQYPLEWSVMKMDSTDDNGPEDEVAVAISEETKLRKVLLRAEHHRTFIDRCRQAHIIPTCLKLNRKVHPIKGDARVQLRKLKWTFYMHCLFITRR